MSLQAALFEIGAFRWLMGAVLLCRGALHSLAGRHYRAMNDFCRVVRVIQPGGLHRAACLTVMRLVEDIKTSGCNTLVDSYLADEASAKCASLYSIAGPGNHDIWRDIIVLKHATPGERGVVLLKYARTFDAVVSVFDLRRLLERYIFVLEPCWTGYCDPSILMFIQPGYPVFVQCFTDEDYDFITSVGAPLVPLRLGPADWVNADLFTSASGVEKEYDLVMVANWARHKRHSQLFAALREIHDRDLRVLLIGFPLGGRTAADVKREAVGIGNDRVQVEVIEQVSQPELADYLSRCKVFVFLSKKEGDNKALVEAMFANVPVIVYDGTVGGARNRVNPMTGVLTSDRDLAATICDMLDRYREFAPRAWAMEHTGSAVSTRVLDDTIAHTVRREGGCYTVGIVEKVNAPNLAYREPGVRAYFGVDYEFVLACRRPGARA